MFKLVSFIIYFIFFVPVVVDIADETGSLKSIHDRPPDQYASEYLQGRCNYVLLRVASKLVS